MTKNEKYIIVETILKSKIGDYLSSYGYEFKEISIIPNMKTTEYLSVVFENTQCEVYFHYQILDFRGNRSEDIFAHICRKPNNSYIIHDILNYEKVQFDKNKFCLFNYEGTFEQQVKQFCDFVIDLFEEYLQEWISGKKWENILFDWDGYK